MYTTRDKVHIYMYVHTSKVDLKFTCVCFKVNLGLGVFKNSKTLEMLTKVTRLNMVNQSYLRMGQAGGFTG